MMNASMNFRSALGGFNREDVVQYIAYMNNKHNAEIAQLDAQLQNALEAAEKAQSSVDVAQLQAALAAAEARCEELEKQLDRVHKLQQVPQYQPEPVKVANTNTEEELEAYRRAERAERLANERAAAVYDKANAVLAEATLKVEAASEGMLEMMQQITQQTQSAKNMLQEAVTAMYAIRPEEE